MLNKIDIDDIQVYENKQRNLINYIDDYSYIGLKYGYIYLIKTNKIVKIGISRNITNRIKIINNSLIDDEIKVVYVSVLCTNKEEIENLFKEKFIAYNIKNEFYKVQYMDLYLDFILNQTYKQDFLTKSEYDIYKCNIKKKLNLLFDDNIVADQKWKGIMNELNGHIDNNMVCRYISNRIKEISTYLVRENDVNKRLLQLYELDKLYDLWGLVVDCEIDE